MSELTPDAVKQALELKKIDLAISKNWTTILARAIDYAAVAIGVICVTCVICAIL